MDISSYDKKLILVKNLDGKKVVKRKSPFNSTREFDILSIENEYIGSARWIRNKLIRMDTTRFDIVGDSLRHNWAMRQTKSDDRMTREIASFLTIGGSSVII